LKIRKIVTNLLVFVDYNSLLALFSQIYVIPVYEPYINKDILKYAHEALDSTWVSSKGSYIFDVEKELTSFHYIGDVKVNNALTCCNGTAATHLVAKALKNFHPNIKNIIVPNNVYVAAWNAFLFDKEFNLIPIEADINTWNIDLNILYELLEKVDISNTALLVVHNIGNIINVPKIQRDWKELIIVEDNCEGFLGKYENLYSGTVSFASSLSFFGNKTLTSGEGGAVIAGTECQRFLYKMRSQGQSDERFIHDALGYNYRMTNVQAGLLKGQLEYLNTIKSLKQNVFKRYRELLSDVVEVSFQKVEKNTNHSNWMFGIRIKDSNYNDIENHLASNFIEARPMFYPINRHAHLSHMKSFGGIDVAVKLNKECIILPSYPELKDHEICHVVNCIKDFIFKNKI